MNHGMMAVTATFAAALSATTAGAATIVSYDTSGDPGNQVVEAPFSAAANVTGMNITRGSGISPSGASSSFSSSGWEGAAISWFTSEYISFGFTVDAGYSVNLTSLAIGTRSSNTGPGTVGLYYNGDGFVNPLYTFVQQGDAYTNSIVNLSALTNLVGTVEFRLIEIGNTQADGSGTTASGGTFRLTDYFEGGQEASNIAFNGEVSAVPEPASLALMALGGVLVASRRRQA